MSLHSTAPFLCFLIAAVHGLTLDVTQDVSGTFSARKALAAEGEAVSGSFKFADLDINYKIMDTEEEGKCGSHLAVRLVFDQISG